MAAAAALVLGSAPLSMLFAGPWLPVVVLSAVAVCGTGGLLRATPLPLIVVPFAQSLVFTLLVSWYLARDIGPAAVLGLPDLVADGVAAVRETAAPVAATPATLALLAVLVFLGALLVETLTVGLGLAGLSGLLLLVLAAVPYGIRPSGSLLLLVAPALGWVLLMACDQLVRMEPVRAWRRPTAHRGWLPAFGMAAASIGCSLVLALTLAPGAETPWLRNWWNGVNPTAASGAAVDPMVSMRSQLAGRSGEEVLRYSTSDGRPAALELVTLELFDGTSWTPYPLGPSVPLQRSAADGPTMDVEVAALSNPYLPVPRDAVSVVLQDAAAWGWDPRTGDAVSTGDVASGLRYRVATSGFAPDPQVLASASSDSPRVSTTARAVPPALPDEVASLAAEVTDGAATNYERAAALQRWFTSDGGFSYSLNVPDTAGRDPLVAFLADRVGFCQQYASAMAAMARTLGIPARVVVGFTAGSPTPTGDFVVTGANAHAWPELWFDDVGWVPFEPTPAAALPVAQPGTPEISPAPAPTPASSAPAPAPAVPPAPDVPPSGSSGGAGWAWWLLAVAGLLPTALAGLAAVRRRRRSEALARVGSAGDLAAGWQEIRDSAIDAGIDWPWHRTLRQQADAVGRALPDPATEALRRLTEGAEHERYAPPGATRRSGPSRALVDEQWAAPMDTVTDVQAVLKALDEVARRPWWRVLPRSLVRRSD